MPGFIIVALGCFTSDNRSEANIKEVEDSRASVSEGVTAAGATGSASSWFPEPTFSVYETRVFPWAFRAISTDAEHWD